MSEERKPDLYQKILRKNIEGIVHREGAHLGQGYPYGYHPPNVVGA